MAGAINVSGVDWPSRNRFYIESLIVHPVLSDPVMVHHVYHLLIEAAMDRSHEQGLAWMNRNFGTQ